MAHIAVCEEGDVVAAALRGGLRAFPSRSKVMSNLAGVYVTSIPMEGCRDVMMAYHHTPAFTSAYRKVVRSAREAVELRDEDVITGEEYVLARCSVYVKSPVDFVVLGPIVDGGMSRQPMMASFTEVDKVVTHIEYQLRRCALLCDIPNGSLSPMKMDRFLYWTPLVLMDAVDALIASNSDTKTDCVVSVLGDRCLSIGVSTSLHLPYFHDMAKFIHGGGMEHKRPLFVGSSLGLDLVVRVTDALRRVGVEPTFTALTFSEQPPSLPMGLFLERIATAWSGAFMTTGETPPMMNILLDRNLMPNRVPTNIALENNCEIPTFDVKAREALEKSLHAACAPAPPPPPAPGP